MVTTSSLLLVVALAICAVGALAQETTAVRFTATSANVSGAGESIKVNLTSWSTDAQRDEFVAAWTLTAPAPAAGGRGGRGGRGGGGGGGARGAGGGGARGARGARGGAATAPAVTDGQPQTDATAATPAVDLPVDPDAPDAAPQGGRGGRGGRGGGRGGGGGGGAAAVTPESSLAAALKKAPTIGFLWTSETVGYSIKYAYRVPQADGGQRIILATDRRVGAWSTLWKPAPTVPASDYPFSVIELRVNSKGEGDGKGVVGGKVVVDDAAKTIAVDGYSALPVILKGVKKL